MEQFIGRGRRLEPGFGEHVPAIEQKLRRRLGRHAIGTPAPMRRLPAGCMEVGGIDALGIHHGIERHQHVLFREFSDPGQVYRDDVVAADAPL